MKGLRGGEAMKKTPLRCLLESYFTSTDEDLKDDWLDIQFTSKREKNKIKSMLYSVKQALPEAKNMLVDVDYERNVIWVHW